MIQKRVSRRISVLLLSLLTFILISCTEEEASDLGNNSLIPAPQSVSATGEYFELSARTRIGTRTINEEVSRIAELLALSCNEIAGLDCKLLPSGKSKRSNVIYLALTDKGISGEEAYEINIEKKRIEISAAQPAGLFRGVQTIKQLLYLNIGLENQGSDEFLTSGSLAADELIEAMVEDNNKLKIPTGIISDFPGFSYRGTMLDVSRHFFNVEDVLRHIDLISFYKINFLHLHLADDQGWRIEIKSWPKLTEIGGSTEVGGGEGGFYTQEEYTEIVDYASEHYITIVPEIDMPGHTNAALASYPELNCSGVSPKLYTGTRVGFSTLCTDKEITYQFVDDVMRELAAITPGPYIHIGGDESHATAKEDYVPFINRVQDIVHAHDKKMIGWDEITHASLKGGSVAQYWASSKNALRAVDQGAQIIMSPSKKCYLDMKYNKESPLGLTWSGFIELDSAYIWNPLTLVKGISKKDILGIESPLWAETIETLDDIQYLAFPRLIGHSEIGWSSPDARDWENYKIRLRNHYPVLDKLEVNYYRSPLIEP